MSITETNPAYGAAKNRWCKNRDVCKGSDAVKAKTTTYLPDDNEGKTAQGQDPDVYKKRYGRYIHRAFFMPFAQHTRNGLVGMVYSKEPTIESWPNVIDYLLEDIDGAGQSHIQLGKRALSDVIEVGRSGLLSDYPNHGMVNPDRQTLEREGIRASIQYYPAESIEDWDTETKAGITRVNFVKLAEKYTERSDDMWTLKEEETRYRVLRLQNGVYTQALYDDAGRVITEEFEPMQNGKTMDHIPFYFIGSEDNQPTVDDAPISGIVDCNISHYQNSADLEQNVHVHSGSTLTMTSSMSSEQFKEANPSGVNIGANEGLFLGQDGDAKLLQLEADSASSNLMEAKERQAEALGAVYANQSDSKNVTAEAARINAAQTTSTLTTAVGNVSEAIEAAATDCAMFMGSGELVDYSLNQDFYAETFNPQIAAMLETGVLNGWINESEAEAAFKKELEKEGVVFQPV